jgi:hypothetical protein
MTLSRSQPGRWSNSWIGSGPRTPGKALQNHRFEEADLAPPHKAAKVMNAIVRRRSGDKKNCKSFFSLFTNKIVKKFLQACSVVPLPSQGWF